MPIQTASQALGNESSGSPFGFKNRIINGAMVIDQRNGGASVTPGNTYTLDRWNANQNVSGKFTVQQNAGSVTPPAGFTNYLGVTSTSAYSVASGDYIGLGQSIEGFNIADLGWGTVNAKPVTISFWVRSSLTGTFSLALTNNYTRGYTTTYTINQANTWEYETITIPGDTTGTWSTNSEAGIRLWFNLGAGSSQNATPNAWGSWVGWSVSGATSVVGTNGATFYITGVQLEKGNQPTSFDYRPYGTELAMCKRYYFKTATSGNAQDFGVGFADSTTQAIGVIPFQVPMRAAPTALEQDGVASDYQIRRAAAGSTCTSVPTFSTATLFCARVIFTTSAVLTAGNGIILSTNANSPYLAWSAEL